MTREGRASRDRVVNAIDLPPAVPVLGSIQSTSTLSDISWASQSI
jgi:hypothetical protein